MRRLVLLFFLMVALPSAYAGNSIQLHNSSPTLQDKKIEARFGKAIQTFLDERGFQGAIVTIFKNGKQVLNQSYGECEADKVCPIASLSKLFTEMAIKQLIAEKVLSYDTKVYSYLGQDCDLLDDRVEKITIKQLLEHKGGWDRDLTPDPLFNLQILYPPGCPRLLTRNEFMKFVFTHFKLDHEPGSVKAYCNFGYFLLGAVIEKATGQSYLEHINNKFAAPNHFTLEQAITPDIYVNGFAYPNHFSLELASSAFGLAAKMSDICSFFSKVDRDGTSKALQLRKEEIWWRDGSLPGSATVLLRCRLNNVIIAIYIPGRDENNWISDNGTLKNLIDNAANSVGL